MARRKVDSPNTIEHLCEVDHLLLRLCEVDRVLESNDTAMNEAITQARQRHAAYAESYLLERRVIEQKLCLFAETHPEHFAKVRSLRFNHGVIGFRKSTKIKLLRRVDEVVQAIQQQGIAGVLVIGKPKINKDALARQPEGVLAKIGAKVDSKDLFFIQTAEQKVEDVMTDG